MWNGIRWGRGGLEEELVPPATLPEDGMEPLADDEVRPLDDGFLHLMHVQDIFCVGSVISHTEFEFASTSDDVVFSQLSFGSAFIATPSDGGGTVGGPLVALIIQSCQARSGRSIAAEQLICVDDMLFWLPRSFEGDSGTVNGGFMSGLLLPVALLLVAVVVEDTRSAVNELDTATVREDAAAGQTADLEVELEEELLPFELLGGDQSSISVTRTYLDG